MRVRRLRLEQFGATVATEEPSALLSVDRVLARRLGADGGALWEGPADLTALAGPTEVHVAVTERCPATCSGCYADARPDGAEPSLAELFERLDRVAALGAFGVAFGGGEAVLRPDLPEVVAHARALGLVPTLTTSGLGVTGSLAASLTGLAQVNVSYDGPPGVYEQVRGYAGAEQAERAMRRFAEAGVPIGMNTVLTRASFPHLEAIAERAAELGVVELQLLRFKPSGRGTLAYSTTRLSDAQVDAFPALLRRLVARHGWKGTPTEPAGGFAIRVDCAMVPLLAADEGLRPEDLLRFGVVGCEPGRSLMTVDVHGDVRPCSFWRDRPADPLDAATWEDDTNLGAFRAFAAALPAPCDTCDFATVCRGGCRIVASVTGEAFAPDPECPRVRKLRSPDP